VENLGSFIFTNSPVDLLLFCFLCLLNISSHYLLCISSCLIIKALLAQGNDTVLLLFFLDSSDHKHRQEQLMLAFQTFSKRTEENIGDSENGNLFQVKICVDSCSIPHKQLKYRQGGFQPEEPGNEGRALREIVNLAHCITSTDIVLCVRRWRENGRNTTELGSNYLLKDGLNVHPKLQKFWKLSQLPI